MFCSIYFELTLHFQQKPSAFSLKLYAFLSFFLTSKTFLWPFNPVTPLKFIITDD